MSPTGPYLAIEIFRLLCIDSSIRGQPTGHFAHLCKEKPFVKQLLCL